MPIGAGTRIGTYEIVAPLGAGGMGQVFRARDTRLKREAALKILPEPFAADADRVARFQREAEVLAALSHPNIAAIYSLEIGSGITAIAMELVEGETLAARIAPGPVPPPEAIRIATQIAAALDAAHERGIVHRDLKPANIVVTPNGDVKVLDFGLAKFADTSEPGSSMANQSVAPTMTSPAMMTRIGAVLGTAAYMAPEQARGHGVDKRADIWAFGCVLYEMLTGRQAFRGESVR
jgi:eukaryotic-like serine/threonine-protein kinase